MNKFSIYCARCGATPGEQSSCVGAFSSHNFISSGTDVFCRRCGELPGEKSSCTGAFSTHDFASGGKGLFCRRCGALPGKKSSCVGAFSTHDFASGSKDAFCRRCGALPGKKSSCVGAFSTHDFNLKDMKPANSEAIVQANEIPQNRLTEAHLSEQVAKTDSECPLPAKATTRGITNSKTSVSILFLAADPSDGSRLRLGEEFREIQEKLVQSKLRDRFHLQLPQLSARPADISQAMLNTEPTIVHFSGHGTKEGALCFENEQGQTQLVQPEAIAALFKLFAHRVNCVLLNACYSEKQAIAIAEHIPYVIGMNRAIGDRAAIAFAVGFYQALGANRSIEDAHSLGCVQIGLEGIAEHKTPVLINLTVSINAECCR